MVEWLNCHFPSSFSLCGGFSIVSHHSFFKEAARVNSAFSPHPSIQDKLGTKTPSLTPSAGAGPQYLDLIDLRSLKELQEGDVQQAAGHVDNTYFAKLDNESNLPPILF